MKTEVSATAGGAIVSAHSNVTIIGSVFGGNSAQAGGATFAELRVTSQSSTAHLWGIKLHLYNHINFAMLGVEFYIPIVVIQSQFKILVVHLNLM